MDPMLRETGKEVNRGQSVQAVPHLGLTCTSLSNEVRYRTIPRKRYLAMDGEQREIALRELYWENLGRLHWALFCCARREVRLYRLTSALFPMCEDEIGSAVLEELGAMFSSVNRRAKRLQVRLVIQPNPSVALSAPSSRTVRSSLATLEKHAHALDLMGLPASPWSAIILTGGKAGRGKQLISAIDSLSPAVRSRLCLENDQAYGAQETLDLCRRAGVPMIFDCHRHAIKEQLGGYEHPSIAQIVQAARKTWPNPRWQFVRLANGQRGANDSQLSQFIEHVPSAYAAVPWIEVEAESREQAIHRLREDWPALVSSPRGERGPLPERPPDSPRITPDGEAIAIEPPFNWSED